MWKKYDLYIFSSNRIYFKLSLDEILLHSKIFCIDYIEYFYLDVK